MSEWRDRLAGSQATALTQALVELSGQFPEAQADAEVDDQARLRSGIEAARAIVLGADANIVSARMIEAPVTAMSQTHVALSSYVSAGDPAQLASANAYLEEVLDALATWLQRPAREARQTVAALQRDSSAVIDDLRARVASVTSLNQTAADEIAQNRDEMVRLVAAAEQSATAALAPIEERQAELNTDIGAQKGRLDAAIAQFQSQFSTSEAQRTEQFALATSRLNEEHTTFMTEQRTAATSAA